MNEHKAFPLFTAFGNINEKYISDALDETPHKNKWYLNSAFLGISAACFCLVAVTTAAMIALGGPGKLSAFFGGNSNTSSHSDHSNNSTPSKINEESMFARDFIKVQYDKFSVGLGAPGDLSNRYTVDDLASVTQLDTYSFDENSKIELYSEDGIKQVDKAFFTSKDYPDYDYLYGESVWYDIRNKTYKVAYGGELSSPDISIWADDKGELVMRIQSFNTDDNSVSQIEGIYPSEMLYTLALEHRKNRTDSLYVTDEQLGKIKSEFAEYIKNHSSVFGEGYEESAFETYSINEDKAFYPTIRYTAKTKKASTAEEQILDYNNMFCKTVTIEYNGSDTYISVDGIAPYIKKTGTVNILPYDEAKKKMAANDGVYAIQPGVCQDGEDNDYCPTHNELLKTEYTAESDMILTYAKTKDGSIIPVYAENRTYKADDGNKDDYIALLSAVK